MEATTTWAEDELYSEVSDNLQCLSTGPLSKSATPLDTFEGAANGYPSAPAGTFTKLSNGWWGTKLDHMTSASAIVEPTLKSKTLKIVPDMPPTASGSEAVVTVVAKNGTTKTTMFSLDRKGNGSNKYPFAKATVSAVPPATAGTSRRSPRARPGRRR